MADKRRKLDDEALEALIRKLYEANGTLHYDTLRETVRGMGFSFSNGRFNKIYAGVMAKEKGADLEIVQQNVEIAARLQRFADLNRIKNKSFREYSRLVNSLEALEAEMVGLLKKYNLAKYTRKIRSSSSSKAAGVIQLADLHFNELVNVRGNVYDFEVAAKRLRLFASRAKAILSMHGVTNVLIANTGDILNSDRRLDEQLNMATNRTSAMLLAVILLQQFILDINSSFNVSYAYVSGNESRVKQEHGLSRAILSDNYDFAINNILKMLFDGGKVSFVDGDLAECLVNVAGQNVLLMHGDSLQQQSIERSVTQIKGKYADLGITISYIFFGDKHYSRVGDTFSRSSSMVGANAYSFSDLHLSSRAAQNVYVFHENGNRDGFKIDLQNADEVEGYDIADGLAMYNPKSEKKLHKPQIVHEVVI